MRPAVFRWAGLCCLGIACGGRADRIVVGADDGEAGAGGTGATAAAGGEGPTTGAGAGGTSGDGGTDTGSAGDLGTGGGDVPTACAPLAPRLIRLTFDQLLASIEALAGAGIADELRQEFAFPKDDAPAFPPLGAPTESSFIDDSRFAQSDGMAELAATRISENMEDFTGCSAASEPACVRGFLTDFAALAYRRPLTDADVANITTVADEAEAIGATPAKVLRTGVYAVLSTPSFLYRTEFGEATGTEGELTLTPYEIADALAFFVVNAPPDAELLEAAGADRLKTPADVAREVDRLLATPAARANLARAFGGYLGSNAIETAIVDDASATSGVLSSAAHELRFFLDDHLFSRPLDELLTSRDTRINADLAALYGVAFPPAGATADADGFAPATLPEQRAGFLTQAGFLIAANATPDRVSPFQRGTAINELVACGPALPSPQTDEQLVQAKLAAAEQLAGSSVRDQVEYRLTQAQCADCHAQVDAYGVTLEGFDLLGRARDVDEAGAPIRDEITLPAEADGAAVDGAAEMASAIAATGAFTSCVARAFLEYALAEGRPERDAACEVERALAEVTQADDPSFPSVIAAIAERSVLGPRSSTAARELP